ncbi:MAG: Holliday junction branch migration protein RuvA [Deltaproteobacteria bacterium]|nr:Holliday junction branch migration protein RuvA [Deltaproteobacteria bacterium]
MIANISGRLLHKSPESAVVDVGGVGYEVFIPLSTYYKLPGVGEQVAIKTLTFIKDDSIHLYGFLTAEEKSLFTLLISVAGVGPRLARNILSGTGVAQFIAAIEKGDIAALKSLPGIGKKIAERVMLELKDSIGSVMKEERGEREIPGGEAGWSAVEPQVADVISALKNLGYRASEAIEAAAMARKKSPEGAGVEEMLRNALRMLSLK